MEPSAKKYVAIVDKAQPCHRIINAIAHLSLGMGHAGLDSGSTYTTFKNRDDATVAILTDHPFIILAAKNGSHLRQIHADAHRVGVQSVAYFANMFSGTIGEQCLEIEAAVPYQHEYVGLVLFGDADVLRGLTKRTSLLD